MTRNKAVAQVRRPIANLALVLLVAGAFFMENLDATVVVTAMPSMAADFGVQPTSISVAISVYALTLAILIPASGWLAERLGSRPVFLSAILLFTLSSVACGLAPSLPLLVDARIVQGVGGAMMVPVGRLVVLRSVEKRDMIRALSTITWPGLIAPVLGPPLGGLITGVTSWRWIFFINVPLGAIALLAAWQIIPTAGDAPARRPFDWTGFVLTGGVCALLVFVLDRISSGTFDPWRDIAILAFCILLGVLAVQHARCAAHPMLDLRAMAVPTFSLAILGGSLFRIGAGAMPFVVPLLLQLVFGFDPFRSGLLVLAVFAGNLSMKVVTTPVLHRWQFRRVLLVNGIANSAVIAACTLFTRATPVALMAALLFVTGLTRSMQFTALNTLAFADVPETLRPPANSLFSVTMQLTLGMGVAFGSALLRLGNLLPGAGTEPTLGAFRLAFLGLALLSLLSLVDVVRLPRDAGDALRA